MAAAAGSAGSAFVAAVDAVSGHTREVRALVVRGDGAVLSTGRDGDVRLWSDDGDARGIVVRGREHALQVVHDVAELPDGMLALAASNATVRRPPPCVGGRCFRVGCLTLHGAAKR